MTRPNDGPDLAQTDIVTTVVADDANTELNTIPNGVERVVVSAVTNDANDWITLPAVPLSMQSVDGWSVVAHELRTPAASNIKINTQDGDGTKEAAIPATTLWRATYINATIGWVLVAWDELAAPITAIVPD